jgi:hypothetical protein
LTFVLHSSIFVPVNASPLKQDIMAYFTKEQYELGHRLTRYEAFAPGTETVIDWVVVDRTNGLVVDWAGETHRALLPLSVAVLADYLCDGATEYHARLAAGLPAFLNMAGFLPAFPAEPFSEGWEETFAWPAECYPENDPSYGPEPEWDDNEPYDQAWADSPGAEYPHSYFH